MGLTKGERKAGLKGHAEPQVYWREGLQGVLEIMMSGGWHTGFIRSRNGRKQEASGVYNALGLQNLWSMQPSNSYEQNDLPK